MRLPPEIEACLAEAARMKAQIERMEADALEVRKDRMREVGEPVREDFTNRHDYRVAVRNFRQGKRA